MPLQVKCLSYCETIKFFKCCVVEKTSSSADMQYIDIRGTSQENIAKEVEEIAKRRGMELEFQVNSSNIISTLFNCGGISKFIFPFGGFRISGVSVVACVVAVTLLSRLRTRVSTYSSAFIRLYCQINQSTYIITKWGTFFIYIKYFTYIMLGISCIQLKCNCYRNTVKKKTPAVSFLST